MSETAEQFFSRAATTGGRIVSSNDLNKWQLSEACVKGNFWVSSKGFGWAILPWDLTTDKDRERERAYFAESKSISANKQTLAIELLSNIIGDSAFSGVSDSLKERIYSFFGDSFEAC